MKNTKTQYFIPYGIILTVFAFLLFYTQFSFCQSDETFYSALLHRLYLGEAMIVDEWNTAQVYSPILYPFYFLYKAVIPSGKGVILFFRIVYVSISGITTLMFFSYIRKKYYTSVALISSLLILLYSRANIQGCSYYNMYFQFVILSVIFVGLAREKSLKFAYPAGITVAFSVICNPFLSIFVMLAWIALFVWKKSERKLLFRLAIGVLVIFIIYIIFILSRTTIRDILDNIGFLFNRVGRKATISSVSSVSGISNKMDGKSVNLIPKPFYLVAIALSVYAFVLGIRKKTLNQCHFIIYCGCIILFIIKAVIESPWSICFGVTFPFAVILFPLFVFRFTKKHFDFPMIMYAVGLLSSAVFLLASNTGLDSMTVGFTISTVAGLLMLVSVVKDSEIDHTSFICKFIPCFALIVSVVIVIVFGCHRFIGIYRDAPVPKLTETLTVGPAAGLKTTPEHAKEYYSLYNTAMRFSEEYPQGQVIFGRTIPWMYLCTNWGYGSPSSWGNSVSNEKFRYYYELHPNKLPQLVFLVKSYVCGYETSLFNFPGSTNKYNYDPLEGWFWEEHLSKAEKIYEDYYVSVYRMSGDKIKQSS